MNKKILAAAIAATCALGAIHTEAGAAVKAKSQALGDLSCLENQIAEFNGELWACIDTPSGGEAGGGAYEFVDGDGNILGDVVFIEDWEHAFGYFDYLSTNSIIEVTVDTNKGGAFWTFSGDFIRIDPGVYYREDDCSGTAYAIKTTREVSLLDLLSVPFYYFGSLVNPSELIFSDVPAPPEFNDSNWYLKFSRDGDCNLGGNAYSSGRLREVGVGDQFELPPTPIFIVEKP